MRMRVIIIYCIVMGQRYKEKRETMGITLKFPYKSFGFYNN